MTSLSDEEVVASYSAKASPFGTENLASSAFFSKTLDGVSAAVLFIFNTCQEGASCSRFAEKRVRRW